MPFRFRDWDLDFIAWLNRTGKRVDFLTDDDLEALRSGDELASAYDLVVFPGHAEYVTQHEYDVVQRYRDDGGNLMFLSANNFFWQVRRDGQLLTKVAQWRNLGRPEAALVGVQFVAGDYGGHQAGYVVQGSPWAFAGTGLAGRRPVRPLRLRDRRALARVAARHAAPGVDPEPDGPGRTAEMTYYETPGDAKVFAAGALNFAASIGDPAVAQLVENVWTRRLRRSLGVVVEAAAGLAAEAAFCGHLP